MCLGSWVRRSKLGSPRQKQDNENLDVVLTGLHWKNSTANQLIASYKYHGVQWVYRYQQWALTFMWVWHRIWNVQTGEVESIIIQQTIPMYVLRTSWPSLNKLSWSALFSNRGPTALSLDCQYLAVMVHGGVVVYLASTGRQLAVLTVKAGQDRPVIFVHHGNTVFAAGTEGEARLWSVPRGRRMQSMRHPGLFCLICLHNIGWVCLHVSFR